MARKRMISPEIWESQSFGELDLLGKVMYIGMISHADDEGRGILSAQLLKSKILPYDVVRNADVEKALEDIGNKTSTVYYEVNGKSYYYLENWTKWQYIQKPIPSKLPSPPLCGEGESLTATTGVTEEYDSSTVGVSYDYDTNRKEKKGKERNRIEVGNARVRACDPHAESFFNSHPSILIDTPRINGIDFLELEKKIAESSFLQQQTLLSFFAKNYARIMADGYKDFKKPAPKKDFEERKYTGAEIDALLQNDYDLN